MIDPARLHPHHVKILIKESGISEQVIAGRDYETVTDPARLTEVGFSPAQRRVPGLLVPVHFTDGGNTLYIFKPDNPRIKENRRKKNADGTYPTKVIKYEMPKGAGLRLDCPPICRQQLVDPSVSLFITEGIKKGDALASRGACCIVLLGVWNFKGKNEYGATTLLADWDHVALNNRHVYVCFDSDVQSNSHVRYAQTRLTEHLKRKGAIVHIIYLPKLGNGKTGVDDWFVANPDKGIKDLKAMAEGPRPEVNPAPEVVELLDDAPLTIQRPLTLINGRGYAAAWPYVRITQTESQKKDGSIIRHNPPRVSNERRLIIVRDDGVVFGKDGHKLLADLGLDVHLPEIPLTESTLSTPAVTEFCKGYRPNPAEVFRRVTECVNRFIDFDHSLADQQTMVEMIACYVLATYFLDSFNVASNLWPNGDRGSGKTQLLIIVCSLAYLGQVILAGGSYASLRDLADYGATLAFDDAENISNPRLTDPDKRTLLLAGNRKGNFVPLKEKDREGVWRTRYVNTYSFRLFSAIKLPDNVLASRTIIIPLIRTPDRYRANADPLDYTLWPHARRGLIDDLWRLALTHLPEVRQYETIVNQEARLTGRNLEPWRAILAVAKWLDDKGIEGIWQRMEQLSMDYQQERPELELSDFQGFMIRGLLSLCANQSNCARCANHIEYVKNKEHWIFTSSQLGEIVSQIVINAESNIDTEKRFNQRVGMALGRMRLHKPPRPGGKGSRLWLITIDELRRWAISYGISIPDTLSPPQSSLSNQVGTAGAAGTVGTTNVDLSSGVI